MPDLSSDPKMMRAQQDKDSPETIPEDETKPRQTHTDSDAESRDARIASKHGDEPYPTEQMDAIFEGNKKRGGAPAEGEGQEQKATDSEHGQHGLARSGRSRLED